MAKKVAKAAKKPAAQPSGRPSQNLAIVALILNLVIPGVGSLVGGKSKEGIIQLVVFIVGVPLTFVFIGALVILAAWVWALLTSIQIMKEAGIIK